MDHTMKLEGQRLTVTAVTNIDEISDRQAVFSLESQKLFVKGKGISAEKLDVSQGIAVLTFSQLDSISYNQQTKWSLKGLFK